MLVLAFSFLIVGTTTFLIYKHREIGAMIASAIYEMNYNNIGTLGIIADLMNKKKNVLKELPSRKGDVAVVTGGNRGIGAEVVKTLIECQIHVILGVRDLKRVESMVASLKEKCTEAEISTYELDVSSMKSVRNFAEIVKQKHPSINLLVNNAGMLRGDYHLTEDGFERQWATNYAGHFLLTHLLMENLKNGGRKVRCSRVVNVSSCMHYGAKLDFEDINMKNWYSSTAGYAKSKLAQLMFSRYLNKLLQAQGVTVKSYAAHPGLVATDMFF